MRLKNSKLQLFTDEVETMEQTRVVGMMRFLFDIEPVLKKDQKYYNGEITAIMIKYALKDAEGKVIPDKPVPENGVDEIKKLLNEPTSDYPLLTPEQGEPFYQYPLTFGKCKLLQQLIKKPETPEEKKE